MRTPLLLIGSLAMVAWAADLPYLGKWKQNISKSDFGQTTLTYESLPGGEWQADFFGMNYKFKMDGKEYPDGMGGTVSWKRVNATTWETVARSNGKVTGTDTVTLSADGNTLSDAGKVVKTDGGTMENRAVYRRVLGGPGLAGKWQTQKVSGAAATMELASPGSDRIVYKDMDMGMSCDAKLDGKDYPCTGPTTPPGFTVAMKNVPPRSLDIEVKKDGTAIFRASYTVAPDGKSMVETGGAVSSNEKMKIAWDRM